MLNFLPCMTFFLVYFSFIGYFTRIERVLYPQIKQEDGSYILPEEINFHVNYDIIDPFALYDNIPQPKYLEVKNYDDELEAYEKYALAKKKYPQVTRGLSKE